MVTEIIDKKLMVEIAHVGKCCWQVEYTNMITVLELEKVDNRLPKGNPLIVIGQERWWSEMIRGNEKQSKESRLKPMEGCGRINNKFLSIVLKLKTKSNMGVLYSLYKPNTQGDWPRERWDKRDMWINKRSSEKTVS